MPYIFDLNEYQIPDEPMDIHGKLLKATERIHELERQNTIMREALEKYARPQNWENGRTDRIERASCSAQTKEIIRGGMILQQHALEACADTNAEGSAEYSTRLQQEYCHMCGRVHEVGTR